MLKKLIPTLFTSILLLFAFAVPVNAADNPLGCTIDKEGFSCTAGVPYYSPADGDCHTAEYMLGLQDACNGFDYDFSCSKSRPTINASNASSRCGCLIANSPTFNARKADCDSHFRTMNSCSGACGGCISDYEDCGGTCVIKSTDPDLVCGQCIAGKYTEPDFLLTLRRILDENALALDGCFTVLQLLGESVNTIVDLDYLKATNATGTEYKYGSGGDPTGAVRLEADWSDSAYGAWYLDWDNDPLHAPDPIPGAIKTLIEGGSSLRLCATADDCEAGEDCSSNGACFTPGANSGALCTDDSDCNLDLFCNASGVCQDPYEGLTACTDNGDCTAPTTCEDDGYCHNMNNGEGAACTLNEDCRLGFICGDDNACHAIPGWLLIADGVVNGAITYSSLNDDMKDRITVEWSGFSDTSYTGSLNGASPNGYEAANSKCPAGAHVCSVNEILTLLDERPETLPANGEAWINGGPPGFTADANDCLGWQSNSGSAYGKYWDFFSNQGWMRKCGEFLPFACCR